MRTKAEMDHLLAKFNRQLQDLFGPHLRETIIFGSYARGEADEGSDVDLMLLVDLPRQEIVRYRRPVSNIAGAYLVSESLLISPIIENEAFFDAHRESLPFYQNIAREGAPIDA